MEMANAVIDVMGEASQQCEGDVLNPFTKQTREILSSNRERSFNGFLLRKDVIKFKVNTQKLLAIIDVLKDQLLIAKFIGSKSSFQVMKD